MLNLFIAGLFEIGWALGMKFNHGFTRFWPSAVTLACMAGSLGFLSRALKSMPIGTAYAVWTGIGAAGTAIIGIVLFSESRSVARLLCIALIIVGVAGLQLATQKGNQSRIKTAQSPHRDGPMTRGELSTLPEQGSSLLLTCSSVLAGPRNLACLQQIPTALRPQNSKTSEGRTIPPDDPGEVARTKVSLR